MKMNKTKIIVPALALAMGAALAGSVSGTVAWFQYSTRAQAAYIGTTAHCSEMLEIQATAVGADPAANGWKGELKASDVATAIGSASGTKLSPITSGVLAKNSALNKVVTTPDDPSTTDVDETVYGDDPAFYANPIYQHFGYNEWEKATADNYAQFDLHFRVKDVNGEDTDKLLTKEVYLTNLSIVSLKEGASTDTVTTDDDNDLYKAIRVHLSSEDKNALLANNGAAAASAADIETVVGANLDLNNDGEFDTTAAYSDWETGTVTAYGGASTDKQVAYNVNKASTFANDSDPAIPSGNVGDIGSFGETSESEELVITVTIWIEGWQGLEEQATATGTDNAQDPQVWDPATYIAKKFGVGMRFAVPAHVAADDE